jgi:hypothetical protein
MTTVTTLIKKILIITPIKIIDRFNSIISKNIKEPSCSQCLQSAMFTINKPFIVGLISSLITAIIGYAIRLLFFYYWDFDLFTNLDDWKSLTYFCTLGGIRYGINEWFKNIFLLSPAISGPDGHMPFSSNSSAGTTFSMSNPRAEGSVPRGEGSVPRGEGSVSRTNASEIEAAKPKGSKASSSKIRKLIPMDNPPKELVKELSELKKDSDLYHDIENKYIAKMVLPFTNFIKLYDPHISVQDRNRLLELMHTEVDSYAEVSNSHDYWKAKRNYNNAYYKKSNEMIQIFETNAKAIQEKLGGKKDIKSEYFRKDLQEVKKIYSDIQKQKEIILKRQLGKSRNTDKLLEQNGISIHSLVNKIIK